jgi:sugar/nucleoside kinase (ribokinase family)
MTAATYDVLGIGNAIVDILAKTEDRFLTEQGMAKGSMALIDEARAAAIYDAMGPATEISGGSAANTIAGIANLGARAAFVGKVRNDQLGNVFSHDIRAAGVAFDTQAASNGPATARCYVLVSPDGERTMNTYLGAAQDLSPADIDLRRSRHPRSFIWRAICGTRPTRRRLLSRPRRSLTRTSAAWR